MKTHIHSAIRKLPVIVLMLLTSACSKRYMSTEEASQWIAAYTPVHIDRDAAIRIEPTPRMKRRIAGRPIDGSIFRFSPSVKGRVVYSADKRFIDFIPDKSLKPGKKYDCRIRMKELTGIDTLDDFHFDFFVDKREIRFEEVKATVDPDDISMLTVTGRLEYNVAAGDSLVGDSTLLECSYPGVRIEIDKSAHDFSRRFRISGIKRQPTDTTLTLSTNPLNGFSKAEQCVTVPSISDFGLLHAERVEAAEPYLDLEFSAPLSSQQELDGLITIDRVEPIRIERSGPRVRVFYPKNSIPDLTLRISNLVKNQEGRRLEGEIEQHFSQEVIPPAVQIPLSGTLLPDNGNLRLPFRAVNLVAVDVEVVKIFTSNVMTFLQENDIDGSYELRRFGRLIYHRTVRLDRDKSLNLHQWQDFSIDLKGLFRQERGAIYNIRLTFRRAYSLYGRNEPADFSEIDGLTPKDAETWDRNQSYISRNMPEYNWAYYNWNETNDPDKASYYMKRSRMPEHNLVVSDLGLIVKRADDNRVAATVTNLLTAAPAAGIRVTAFNYQLQKTGGGTTDANGFVDFATDNRPFLVTATDGRNTTYLKVSSGRELSTSRFDVSGKHIDHGLKGFVYGDRDIWRPGDRVHLSLIVEDKQGHLPANHPVVMELYNPSEQLYDRQTVTKSTNGFYVFHTETDESVPTGLWEATFTVGDRTFRHPVRIETIKPNRLKIKIRTPEMIRANREEPLGIEACWLTGPVAKLLDAGMEMTLYADPRPFKGYKNYLFSNPLVSYTSSHKELFSEQLDSTGSVEKLCTTGTDRNAPGMLLADITAKVTEPGGDISVVSHTVPFSPFEAYVGIDLGEKTYPTDTEVRFPVVVLDQQGGRMKSRRLDYKIYRLDWDWWWEGNAHALNRYVRSSSADLVASGPVTVTDGGGEIPFRVDYPGWGRYLILVRDSTGGHATGGTFRVDWPDGRGHAENSAAAESTELSFTLDKKRYEAGETASVYLPKCAGGRVLLSIENGSGVLRRMWAKTSPDSETVFPLPVDRSMAPNFYVTATLLRPHRQTSDGVPIRLFGIAAAEVVDSRSILHPEIEMPDELHPQKPFTVRIGERDHRPMTYTLAIVDEGLLDITNFRTPNPWAAMNQREALGVKTWDMYDDVIGTFGGSFRPVLSIGGDQALRRAAGKEKRFNPAVRFLGPFTVKGAPKTHRITLPNYVGSVRVMVVAAHRGSYGHADKTVRVTAPLMLLTSLPRVLACGDTIGMPVNLFARADEVKHVSVSVETEGPVKVVGAGTRSVAFAAQGEKPVDYRLVCDKSAEGKARIVVTAASGRHIATDTVYIDVRNPLPTLVKTTDKSLAGGKTATFDWTASDNGTVGLQIASMPAFRFGEAMTFLENYRHLCTEQLASKALFMLFGREFLDSESRRRCDHALPRLLQVLTSRQLANGGFVYWPEQRSVNEWVTSMAGMVLTEAEQQGFRVEKACTEHWSGYQTSAARNYRHSAESDLGQAYRLYTLAKAGYPQAAAMNRLRESKTLTQTAAYCLASAYALCGRKEVAESLIERAERTAPTAGKGMFRSTVRDNAMQMEAYTLCGLTAKAMPTARMLAKECAGDRYVTQDIAFVTIAMHRLGHATGNRASSVTISEKGRTPVLLHDFGELKNVALSPASGHVTVSNTGTGTLELSLVTASRPAADTPVEATEAGGLQTSVSYTDLSDQPIAINRLKQNTEFKARITVTNRGKAVDAMALTYAVPSGWEIWNERLYQTGTAPHDHQDIRDNSVSYYFPLAAGSSVTFTVRLRAAYCGKYMLPPTVCEDMYHPVRKAMTANRRVAVER